MEIITLHTCNLWIYSLDGGIKNPFLWKLLKICKIHSVFWPKYQCPFTKVNEVYWKWLQFPTLCRIKLVLLNCIANADWDISNFYLGKFSWNETEYCRRRWLHGGLKMLTKVFIKLIVISGDNSGFSQNLIYLPSETAFRTRFRV